MAQVCLRLRMTAWNFCLGTGLATVVYHFRGWSSGADTFASRCPQGPISVPGPEARPQVGSTVAVAWHVLVSVQKSSEHLQAWLLCCFLP